MSEYADRLLRRIEAIDQAAAENGRRTETYQRMTGELAAVEGHATSPDGVVSVISGPGGDVRSITFGPALRGTAPEALSAIVLHTLAKAKAEAAKQQAEVVRRGLGDTELLDRVVTAEERLFGDRPPADPGPAPVVARRQQRARDDGFFEEFNVMRRGTEG
ncbi:MAG TPA: YbaB/EbfC family nucleoid-associated protein [Amycolatopsis sp.]|jgi:DNA-binding protein YbaB|nr:YbaB/EbfC family nucleoid-associated protein [Amycolatopsis sp.]